jgi:hypothetical protein
MSPGLDVRDLGVYVVRPTLAALATVAPGIDGPVAEALLLATAAQESQLRFLHQQGGPALGLWQMEPATHDDIWLNSMSPKVRDVLMDHLGGAHAIDLIGNLSYACAMARLLYWRSSVRMPAAGDAAALWPIYKEVYNTPGGAATQPQFLANFANLVQPHWPPPA